MEILDHNKFVVVKGKRISQNVNSLRGLWDNIKCTNIPIRGVPEGKEIEKGKEII